MTHVCPLEPRECVAPLQHPRQGALPPPSLPQWAARSQQAQLTSLPPSHPPSSPSLHAQSQCFKTQKASAPASSPWLTSGGCHFILPAAETADESREASEIEAYISQHCIFVISLDPHENPTGRVTFVSDVQPLKASAGGTGMHVGRLHTRPAQLTYPMVAHMVARWEGCSGGGGQREAGGRRV